LRRGARCLGFDRLDDRDVEQPVERDRVERLHQHLGAGLGVDDSRLAVTNTMHEARVPDAVPVVAAHEERLVRVEVVVALQEEQHVALLQLAVVHLRCEHAVEPRHRRPELLLADVDARHHRVARPVTPEHLLVGKEDQRLAVDARAGTAPACCLDGTLVDRPGRRTRTASRGSPRPPQ